MVTRKLQSERQAVLDELVRLAPKCEINETPRAYCSLVIGARPNKNAVIIPRTKNHVSFYLEDLSLVESLRNVGLIVEAFSPGSKQLINKDKYRVLALTQSEIKTNETLIRKVLDHSFTVMANRRSKKATS